MVSDIDSSKVIKVEADFTSYGSGYASYVDVFCYKRDGSSMKVTEHGQDISGIALYLCKLAPVAVWGENSKSKHSKGGCYGFLSPETVESLPEGDWNEFMFILKDKLNKHRIEILKKRYVRQALDFDTKIPTLLNTNNAYKVFDALFYWED